MNIVPEKKASRTRLGRLPKRVTNAGILPSTVMVLLTLLVGAAVVWVLFTRLLRDAWPWQVDGLETGTRTPGFQLMQLVLTLVGGIGAAILVVVAYRRQRDLETARFDDRFAAAAAQLGAETAAERLAGVYAMAALADSWERHQQQCINVLCAYLRLPYDPSAGLLSEVVSEHTWHVGSGTGKEIRTYKSLPNDREVRLTIVRVITEHLRADAPIPWVGRDFDFTGATFDGADFSGARFIGGSVSFRGAVFASGTVSFRQVEFNAAVTFSGSWLTGAALTFSNARFSSGRVSFRQARFSNGSLSFRAAQFEGSQVAFEWASILAAQVNFSKAAFRAGEVSFLGSEFRGGSVLFVRSHFRGAGVKFTGTTFEGSPVAFDEARFVGGSVTFDGAVFKGGVVDLSQATFGGAIVTFDQVIEAGGEVLLPSNILKAGYLDGLRPTRDGGGFGGFQGSH